MRPPLWTVELHSHTLYSGDCLMRLPDIVATCRRKGIDRLSVTDHNTARGAFALAELAPDLVIPGEEILTSRGELLAYFISEEVPAGLSPRETIERLRRQGAVISVSHPFDRYRKGAWNPADLLEILPLVDAIEVFNARCLAPADNARAAALAEGWQAKTTSPLLGTIGSDAHSHWELGRAVLRMTPFSGPQEFLAALSTAERLARLSPAWVHLSSRYAAWRKRRARRDR